MINPEENENQNPNVYPREKSRSCHSTHSFLWSLGQKKPTQLTCYKAGTVEDSLRKSSQFRENKEKNKDKELVILKGGKPIPTHFPCTMIQPEEQLKIRYVKNSKGNKSVTKAVTISSEEIVVFHLRTKGGKGIAKILRNPELRSYFDVTVYAYKGEKLKYALKRDGRFLKTIFKKTCALSYLTANVEMSNLVDDLDGKTFQIIMLNKNCPPESQPSSLEDSPYFLEQGNNNDDNREQGDDDDDDNTREQGDDDNTREQGDDDDDNTREQGDDDNTREQGDDDDDNTREQGDDDDDDTREQGDDDDDNTREQGDDDDDDTREQGDNDDDTHELDNKNCVNILGDELHEIPDSKGLRSYLSSLVSDIEKKFTGQGKDKGQLLSVEYGRSQGSVTVKTMKKLMSMSDSVCQVRIGGSPVGSGFLLFGSFALTNFHVVREVFDQNLCKLFEPVRVHFSFESLDQATRGHQVQEVVAWEYGTDTSGHKCDWALLKLTAEQELPSGLLKHLGFIPQSGSICIIGHPDGGVKKIDQSWILTNNSHSQIIKKHYNENLKYSETGKVIQFLTPSFVESVLKALHNNRDLTYETCFFFGSSGSPVFDNHCNVVAMHSAGFVYKSCSGETQSVIEYGHPLSSILENLIVQLVYRERLDVLKQSVKVLTCFTKHYEAIFYNVKKLVSSQNCTVFQHIAHREIVLNDEALKMFFEFICEPDTPVSMDIE